MLPSPTPAATELMTPAFSEVRPPNYARAVNTARYVLLEAGIHSFPVSLATVLRYFEITLISYSSLCEKSGFSLQDCITFFGPDGAFAQHSGSPVIFYNNDPNQGNRIRFTIAHELGHYALKHHEEGYSGLLSHPGVNDALYAVMEEEANCFARNFLAPPMTVHALFRLYGLMATHYNMRESRNEWLKVPDTPASPDLPERIHDASLVRSVFQISSKAAGVRCHFLHEDMKSLHPRDRNVPPGLSLVRLWGCPGCGESRPLTSRFCHQCGKANQQIYVWQRGPAEEAVLPPPFLMTPNLRLVRCLYCGYADSDPDALFCVRCGNPVVNACLACGHRNISLSRRCEDCGRPTIFSARRLIPDEPDAPFNYLPPPLPPPGPYTRMKLAEDCRKSPQKKKGRTQTP